MMRLAAAAAALLFLVAPLDSAEAAESSPTFTIGYLDLADDPRQTEHRSYADILLRPAVDPMQGARAALEEGRIMGRIIGADLALDHREATSPDEMVDQARRLAAGNVRLMLIDAPGPMVAEVAKRTRDTGIFLFNVSASADGLRGRQCQRHLLHVVPSEAMFADALAQFAASHNWRKVLVLQGPRPEDAVDVRAFLRSAKRFGLEITDVRQFTQTNDPRKRNTNRTALLTSDVAYDLILVADADSEFGRHVAYRSLLPRPVIGSHGLGAAAWHWAYERHGAPQLSQRFERLANRRMTDADWAAWAAVSMIIRGAAAVKSTDAERVVEELMHPELTFDTYKGTPGSFRPWNNQLRQPILMHTGDAVVGVAPLEGFLHPSHYLDTLGRDRPEAECELEQ